MLRNRHTVLLTTLAIAAAALYCRASVADTVISEDFTGATTNNPWYFFNGACLTASSSAATSNPGTPPGCTADSYYTENLVGGYNGVSGSTQTLPDPTGEGALRFTNGCLSGSCGSGGYNQNGAIISANTYSTAQGLDITFKTVSYRGNSLNVDGADGMSFFLMNGNADLTTDPVEDIGSYGGSLGYTCSNVNSSEVEPYHGMVGAYLGLGIDEYGNFLNGINNTEGTSWSATGDNTASGGGYKPNRIGIRGGGNIAWAWLTANYPSYYPATLTSAQQAAAVQNTCKTGTLWDYGDSTPSNTGTAVLDYPAIPGAYTVISSKIANEYKSGGYARTNATPITYRLKITETGLLSLQYSYNGGAWTQVLQNQDISNLDGPMPDTVRFGFAGSSGGGTNIHEILCFKATPATSASSSTTVNQQESSKVENGSQAYFGYYNPTDWAGRLTANSLLTSSTGVLTIASTANWDASCVLTGVASGSSCPTTGQAGAIAAESPSSRTILTWSGSAGIPFEWTSLTSAEQSALDAGDATQTANRLNYLRGDRSNEVQTNGTGLYRDRDSVLADIIDSSPTWVGPPSKSIFSSYETPTQWRDKLYPSATMLENSGQTYTAYAQAEAQRLNVVYIGANDGLVHGFSAGSYDSTGTVYNSTTNTGQEVLAYMPQGVLEAIHSATNSQIDYSNVQYGHAFSVDATPGTGDLYYGGAWHTWLVGGLGAGGAEIYALDVTHPSTFAESNAASLVKGDWTPSTISCVNVSSCGSNLGNTYGIPQIRLLHNGDWGVIFGNGLGSSSGDAGIYILTIDPTSGAQSMYYLSTGVAGGNGITFVSPVDMDGDHVVDYVYAGDELGNVWRFNLTSNSASSWHVSTGPVFKTPSGQPITSAVQPDFVTGTNGTYLMLYFGTGQKFAITNTTPTSYASGTQSFYGVWDWNMAGWNALNSSQYASLSASATGLSAPYTLQSSNLALQTVQIDSSTLDRTIQTTNPVCWAGTTTCSSGSGNNNQFGWYINLPGTNSAYSTTTYEQVTYNPMIVSTAVVFNSVLPAVDSPLACSSTVDQGWTYALDVRTGGPLPSFFVNNGNTHTIAFESDASGTSSEVTTSNGSNGTNYWLIYQTSSGGHGQQQIQPPNDITGSRLTWLELR